MARPPRQRIVASEPIATVYKPAGIPARQLQWTNLTLDEFEAIRLIDGERLDQETVAAQMGVSRPTVTRILASGRSKIARVLTNGQALAIQGGPVVSGPMVPGRGRAGGFGHGWGRRRRGRGTGTGTGTE
jgi:predicted DNA-binding protein (UPF0251 family)